MTQIFRESSNAISFFTISALALGGVAFAFGYYLFWKSPSVTHVGQYVPQPVLFSHKHHVKGIGLDCRFCHAQVEKASNAGLPSTQVCMSCHSQLFVDSPELKLVHESWEQNKPLQWNRVNDLPDYVFFNHSMHIHKGVSCLSCHGHIEEMPLVAKAEPMNMQWCLNCHFNPEKYVSAREQVFSQDPPNAAQAKAANVNYIHLYHIDKARMRNCYECHH